MLKNSRLRTNRPLIWILCLVLATTLIGAGSWLWHRSVQQKMKTYLVNTAPRSVGILWPKAEDGQSMPETSLPANATPEMKEYVQNQATLNEKIKQLQSQSTNGAPDPHAFALFQEQNIYLLKRQNELAKVVAQQQARNPLPMPAPVQMPPDASPQLRAFLTTRDQLAHDQVAYMNQHRNDDAAARQAAMEKWQQQNAPRYQQLQQEAQVLKQVAAAATPTK